MRSASELYWSGYSAATRGETRNPYSPVDFLRGFDDSVADNQVRRTQPYVDWYNKTVHTEFYTMVY